MSITFTDELEKPNAITGLPNQMTRPAFGTLYGFDVPTVSGVDGALLTEPLGDTLVTEPAGDPIAFEPA